MIRRDQLGDTTLVRQRFESNHRAAIVDRRSGYRPSPRKIDNKRMTAE